MKRTAKPDLGVSGGIVSIHHAVEALDDQYILRLKEELPDDISDTKDFDDMIARGMTGGQVALLAGYSAHKLVHDLVHDIMGDEDDGLKVIKDREVRELAKQHKPRAWDSLDDETKRDLEEVLGVTYED